MTADEIAAATPMIAPWGRVTAAPSGARHNKGTPCLSGNGS